MFKSDLEFGVSGEKEMIDIICKNNPESVVILPPNGRFKGWDFEIDEVKYEVKTDRMSHKTGNLVVEVECNNKPSGLSTTDANYWIFNLDKMDKYVVIKTEQLKELIVDTKKINGGYRKKSVLHVLPIENIPEQYIKTK
jgi:hypothetical protein